MGEAAETGENSDSCKMVITWIWKPRPGRFQPVSSLNISNDSTWYRAEPMTSKPKTP